MRIVSQDKRYEINYEQTLEMSANSIVVSAGVKDAPDMNLGIYKTEERALEVLEDMRESYKQYLWNKEFGLNLNSNAYYYMPKE